MIRNPISLTLTALLFTVLSMSCRKESATPEGTFNHVPGTDAAMSAEQDVPLSVNAYDMWMRKPVYDFIKPSTGDRMLTLDSAFSHPDWTLVGVAFRVMTSIDPHFVRLPVYEYYNDVAGDHAYSLLPDDPGILSYPNWRRNTPGAVFYVQSDNLYAGTVPVYSYYNAGTTTHLYSTDPDIASKYPGWGQKYLAWYAWPAQ